MKCLTPTQIYMLVTSLATTIIIINAHGPGPGNQWENFSHRRRSFNESMQSRAVDTTIELEVAEGEPKGTVVGYIPTKIGFKYRFNEPLKEFTLDPVTGEIRTNVELDREALATDHYDLVILSSQPTYPIEVRIYVSDINDHSPEFPEPVIAVSFSESNPAGTRLLLDAATDKDLGVNSITDDYQIIDGNIDDKFRLAVTTNPSGDVSYLHLETTGTLDRETRAFYVLNISARDGGIPQRYGYLQVNVSVIDTNDNPPIFDHSDYIVSLNESILPGSAVLQVMASDNDEDENARISYYLAETETQFAVDAVTGQITTTDKISCPQQDCVDPSTKNCHKSCVFTVFARDHGNPRQDGRTYVTVNLLATNDHDPVIKFQYFPSTSSFATVDENAANGSVVGAISVDDMDEGPYGKATLKIIKGNERNHFRLEATSSFYLVRVNGILDREEINNYNLTVAATDSGSPPRTATAYLIIKVNDVNDHEPVFEKSEYTVTLSELVPAGSFVASIIAKDEDTGVNAQVSYNFISGNQRKWFHIVQESGLIITTNNLDREIQDSIVLNISAHDGGPNPKYAYTELKITLLDENDEAPKFVKNDIKISLKEDTPLNTVVVTLTAIDPDQGTNGSVSYSLDPFDETKYLNSFYLDPITGKLVTKKALDREEVTEYTLHIIASDHGTPVRKSIATVTLTIEDINDNTPIFYPTHYFAIVDDTIPVGTSLVQLKATDRDTGLNGLIKYNIQSGDDTALFDLNSSTGLFSLKNSIESYPGSSYMLSITAIDGGSRRVETQATVKIMKSNRVKVSSFKEVSEPYKLIEDDASPHIGRTVGRVVADMEGLQYLIVDGDPTYCFKIDDDGLITTAKLLTENKYQILPC